VTGTATRPRWCVLLAPVAVGALALGVAACGDDGSSAASDVTTSTTAAPDAAAIRTTRDASEALGDVAAAEAAGYQELTDAAGIECIDQPGEGAMGIHYVDQANVGDGVLDPDRPEAVVFAPHADGTRTPGAVEYVVLQEAWDQAHPEPPRLFGQDLVLTPSPNRFGLPAYYSLHVWAWEANPAGTFAMWNPEVACSW
jgi:hypothetical protein